MLPDFKLYYKATVISKQYNTGIKETHRQMEKNEELRNKSMHVKSTNIWQRSQEYSLRKR